MRINLKLFLFPYPLVLCGLLLFAETAFGQTPLPVTVSIIPQKYFVEKIGGPLVEIEVMVPPGATPEQYEPKPKQMAAISMSKIYFACGVPSQVCLAKPEDARNPYGKGNREAADRGALS
jgi:zinc transport system substrate-binding protein